MTTRSRQPVPVARDQGVSVSGSELAVAIVVSTLVFVALVLIVVFVVVRRFGPRPPFATFTLTPGSPFEVQLTMPRATTAKLWLFLDAEVDVEVRPPRIRRMHDYIGIEGDAWANGREVARYTLHTGTVCPPEQRTPAVAFHVARTDLRNPGSLRQTLRVATLAPLRAGDVVTVRGYVAVGAHVRPRCLELRVSA